jgi:3-methyladenine DNA glycosylase/8-oxoguanine DNA glycosylase
MPLKEQLAAERQRWKLLTAYQKFEHVVLIVLSALIAVVVAFALWNLVLKVLLSILSSGGF